MANIRTILISAMLLFLLFTPFAWAGTYSGGSGMQEEPYRIGTVADWQELMATSTDWNKCFVLIADVNLAEVSVTPLGNYADKFTGVFDGGGYVIRNVVMNMPSVDYVGLFGCIGTDGQIKNLGIKDTKIVGHSNVGCLVGCNYYGDIDSCYATGFVSGYNYIGGLVGMSVAVSGGVTSCHSAVCVDGYWCIGGLVGDNHSNILSCYATGVVTGDEDVGGLVGSGDEGSVTYCHATGPVSGTIDVGGLMGFNYSTVTSCHAIGPVSGRSYVGGLMGKNFHSSVIYCYATGDVTGTSYYAGGLVGYNDYSGNVNSCYATGVVSGNNSVGGLVGNNRQSRIVRCYSTGKPTGTSNVGGLCGVKTTGGSYEDTGNFWDTETSQTATSAMGAGKTTAEMQTKSTFTSAGWDFINVWKIKEHIDYPHFIWEDTSPVACIVGSSQTIEAQGLFGATVTLDGSCSSDADSTPGTNDDINDFDWYRIDPCDVNNEIYIGSGEIIDCNLPLGTHTIILEVADKADANDSNEITIVVQDTTPPDFELSVSPNVLWPPNGKMIKITSTCIATDLCDPSPAVSLNITANEPCDPDDIKIAPDGSISLCANRSENSKGRIYTITCQACDESVNCTTKTANVTVPHDMRK